MDMIQQINETLMNQGIYSLKWLDCHQTLWGAKYLQQIARYTPETIGQVDFNNFESFVRSEAEKNMDGCVFKLMQGRTDCYGDIIAKDIKTKNKFVFSFDETRHLYYFYKIDSYLVKIVFANNNSYDKPGIKSLSIYKLIPHKTKNFVCNGGLLSLSNYGGLELEINDIQGIARYRYYNKDISKWQTIKYDKSGAPYIIAMRIRYYLNDFMC